MEQLKQKNAIYQNWAGMQKEDFVKWCKKSFATQDIVALLSKEQIRDLIDVIDKVATEAEGLINMKASLPKKMAGQTSE